MGIQGLNNINSYHKSIIESLLKDQNNLAVPSLSMMIYLANSKKQNDYVYIKRGLHTSYDLEVIAKQSGFFTPTWFDVLLVQDGEPLNDGKMHHVYISKYVLNQHQQWQRINFENDAQLGYTIISDMYDDNFYVSHSFTGLVTDRPTKNVFYGGKKKK